MGEQATIPPPDPPTLLTPLIRALSSRARPAELPNLAPILRQRVELLSDDSSGPEPWYRYLCYDPARAAELVAALDGGALNPHPASGDIEVDWEADGADGVAEQFRRLDEETLEACVVLRAQGITFKLRYDEGEGRGWKVAEVSVVRGEDGFGSFDGSPTMEQAEEDYARMNPDDGGAGDLSGDFSGDLSGDRSAIITTSDSGIGLFPHEDGGNSAGIGGSDSDSSVSEDDDEYWNSYGRSPNRTPGSHPSPPPASRMPGFVDSAAASAEDAYYARYENVQPAMDPHPHDPEGWEDGASVLSLVVPQIGNGSGGGTNGNGQVEAGSNGVIKRLPQMTAIPEESEKEEEEEREEAASAAAAADAAEGAAARGEAFQDHVRKSIESLGVMAGALGIDRAQFAAMVRDELEGE